MLTEVGELTFPADASVDELNCDLDKDGSRRRRLGLELEAGAVLTTETLGIENVVTTDTWFNVAEQTDLNFTLVQNGSEVYFFDGGDGSSPLSAQRLETTTGSGTDYALNLVTYARPTSTGAGSTPIQAASIKGVLILSSPEINTIMVTWTPSTGAFTVTEIEFRVRDFEWQGDTSTYSDVLATGSVTDARIYDTKNASWSDGPNGVGDSALTTYEAVNTEYPPLTHPWYSGKNATDVFSKTEFDKVYAGSSLAANGHYVLDLYSKDRQTASGIASSTYNTTETARFSTVASYSGRAFYSGMNSSSDDNGNKIFFSQILEQGTDNIGELLQVNDPTSEYLPDLLDTDGGYIVIPEAHDIIKLHPFGAHLYVFASNGVWRIGGIDDVFRAGDYTVNKLTEDGITVAGSFVSAQGQPYWWSNNGIFTLTLTESGQIAPSNISVQTIQTFWNDIGAGPRGQVQAVYDETNRRVTWMYPDAASDVRRNSFLVFDEVLQAWFPWRVAEAASNSSHILGATFISGVGIGTTNANVVDSSDELVVTSTGEQVTVEIEGASLSSSKAKYLILDGATSQLTFAEFTDTDFEDWGSVDYSSYAEAAYNFMGDMETRKSTPYLTVYLKDTATGWSDNGDGSYEVIRDSSCLVSAYFDFRTTASSSLQQAFRRKHTPVVDDTDLSSWSYPETVITSRLKIRGRGRSARLRFESEAGKDFHLLGYNTLVALNGRF